MPDNTLSTLTQIRNKARRLSRRLSANQLSDSDLDQYINTFVLYDFPEHLRLFNLKTTFNFYTQPGVDVYDTNTTDTTSPLYNFRNKYLTIHPPIYVSGYQALYSESREQFFGIYPMINSIASIGTTGDGSTLSFPGVVNSQQGNSSGIDGQTIFLLQNNVVFDSIDLNGNGLVMTDYPISNTIGNLRIPDQLPTSTITKDPNNYINYVTGQFVVTFATAPGSGQPINSQTVPQQPTIPQALLFYDSKFTLRPVPDQPYKINMEVFARPTELLLTTQMPLLSEWWQYIAYGAAKKIMEDVNDLDGVSQIMPEFKKQEALVNRRTIVQQTSQRVSSIYTEQIGANGAYGPGWFGGGSQF